MFNQITKNMISLILARLFFNKRASELYATMIVTAEPEKVPLNYSTKLLINDI